MTTFAEGTSVPVEKTRADLEALLRKQGVLQRAVALDEVAGSALVLFTVPLATSRLQIRLELTLPKLDDVLVARPRRGRTFVETRRLLWEQRCRERWRAMFLLVKAKFVAIELGVSTVEREFLADIALPDGSTVGARMTTQLELAYERGSMPPLLGMRTDA